MATAKHVITFMRTAYRAELNWSRITKYLQPDSVGRNYYATDEESFRAAVAIGSWDVLVTDPDTWSAHAILIDKFIARRPTIVVGMEGNPALVEAPRPKILEVRSADIDDWLASMHALLAAAT